MVIVVIVVIVFAPGNLPPGGLAIWPPAERMPFASWLVMDSQSPSLTKYGTENQGIEIISRN